jgi:sugar phosphate isomerase/epimerase
MTMKAGLQMYTVRNGFKKDPMGTLEIVAKAGYRYIELANHFARQDAGTGFGVPADKLKKKIDSLHIKVIGAHVMPLEESTIDGVIKYHQDIGSKNISIPIDYWPTKAHLLDRCKFYNKIGEILKKNGMKLLFHNHWHEFQKFGNDFMFDLIMANTEPDLLGIELDAYWTIRGALDPAEKIRQYKSRMCLLHEKDFPLSLVHELNAAAQVDPSKPVDDASFHATVKPEHFTEVGDGMIKVQDVIDAGNEAKVPYIFVEQDFIHNKTEFESISRSLANFKKMRGMEWD